MHAGFTHAPLFSLSSSCSHLGAHARTRAHAHTHARTHTHSHTNTHTIQTHTIQTHTRTHAHTHAHTHTHMHTYIHTRAHTLINTHAHTRARIHTQLICLIYVLNNGHVNEVMVMCRVGQNHIYTVYIRYFWLGNHQLYGVCIHIYTVLATPSHVCLYEPSHHQ
jgi:hypothetical protein